MQEHIWSSCSLEEFFREVVSEVSTSRVIAGGEDSSGQVEWSKEKGFGARGKNLAVARVHRCVVFVASWFA